MYEYWHKQSLYKPLHPDLDWDKPERKDLAGRLLIIGGHQGAFHGAAEAYRISQHLGIGEVKTLMPDSLRKITQDLPDISYAPSNQTGNFSVNAKESMLYAAQWAEGVLLSGEYGRNSEASIALSFLIRNYSGLVVLTKDAIDILNSEMLFISKRPDTFLVCSYSQLQKIAKEIKEDSPFKYSDDLSQAVKHLHEFTIKNKFGIITKHGDYLIASLNGEVITTERKDLSELWCLDTASAISVNCIQYKNKKLQGIANSLLIKIN